MPYNVDAGPYSVLFKVTAPRRRVRPVAKARAALLRRYPRASMAASTRMRVVGFTPGCLLITRETVWCETPARRATSVIAGPRSAVGLLAPTLTVLPTGRPVIGPTRATELFSLALTQMVKVGQPQSRVKPQTGRRNVGARPNPEQHRGRGGGSVRLPGGESFSTVVAIVLTLI